MSLDRFMKYVSQDADGCWRWLGFKNRKGYGQFWMPGTGPMAHRVAWTLFRSEIPKGLQIDHLCRNRACVNPDHLEVVSLQENVARGKSGQPQASRTHCPLGHEYSPANTYFDTRGSRNCRVCKRADCLRRYYAKRLNEANQNGASP